MKELYRGYTIRQQRWREIIDDPEYKEIADQVKSMVRDEYIFKRRNKIILDHDRKLKKYSLKKSLIGIIETKTKKPRFEIFKNQMMGKIESSAEKE